jgi:hypothetical protein
MKIAVARGRDTEINFGKLTFLVSRHYYVAHAANPILDQANNSVVHMVVHENLAEGDSAQSLGKVKLKE